MHNYVPEFNFFLRKISRGAGTPHLRLRDFIFLPDLIYYLDVKYNELSMDTCIKTSFSFIKTLLYNYCVLQ